MIIWEVSLIWALKQGSGLGSRRVGSLSSASDRSGGGLPSLGYRHPELRDWFRHVLPVFRNLVIPESRG